MDEPTVRPVLLQVIQPLTERPCSGCVAPCACSGSPSCNCGCSRACPKAGAHLSTDPERYPIETAILPLVYELNALRGVEPCWSCEGHVGPNGELTRLPQVWFYASDGVLAHVLGSFIQHVTFRDRLSTPWIVAVTDFGASMTAYACRPDPWDPARPPSLPALQHDARVLADRFATSFRGHVSHLLTTQAA